ncbi:MAG: holo-ACP synthase [Butyribacter sp.]|nr:holo-ACP synthase [bacterium]MDY3855211.1 holo-ACP synthase [Butyribacter sp.]
MEKIIGIGIDHVEVDRVLKACEKERFVNRLFSEREQSLIQQRKESAATNFAGKEAVVKCFGTGFKHISPKDVEILRNENGAPYVVLNGNAKKTAESLGISKIHISLSDTETTAVAYAIAVGQEEKRDLDAIYC